MGQKNYPPLEQAHFYLEEMRAGQFESESGEVYPNKLEQEIQAFPMGREAALLALGVKEEELRAFDLLYLVSLAKNAFERIGQALEEERLQEASEAFMEVERFAEGQIFQMNTEQSLSLLGLNLSAYSIMKESFTMVRNALDKQGK